MRKSIFIISALLLVAATACRKDDSRILNATIERYDSNDAKAYINSDNYACWKSGDEVSINGSPYTITLDQEGHAVIDVSDLSHAALTAFYPAHRIDGTTVTFPYVQEYNADDQGRQIIDNPMAAYCPADGTELRFRNLGALLKVTLKPANTIQVRAIEVKGVDNQMLCGKAQLTSNSNGDLVHSQLTDGCNSVVLHFNTPQEVTSAGKEFYIVVPAGSNFNDLTIAVLASENGTTYSHHCKTNTIAQALSRNHIGAISYALDHNDDTFVPAWGMAYTSESRTPVTPYAENWGGTHRIDNSPYGMFLFDDILTTIGTMAFQECTTLESITLPFSVTSIGDNAFANCASLNDIHLPSNLTSFGNSAFNNCSSLESIVLPDKLTSIGFSTFFNCSSLESIVLPDKLTSIGNFAFSNCGLINIVLPNGLQSIGERAFLSCTKLTSISIPNGITEIKAYTFSGCTSLHYIYCYPTTPPSIADNPFYGLTQSISVFVPEGNTNDYRNAWTGTSVDFTFREL